MNTLIRPLTGLALALTLLGTPAAQATVFTLNPADGAVFGHPGETVGWGFTLYNDTPEYLMVTSASFQSGASNGTFTDFLGPQLLELAPGATAVQDFDLGSRLGLGSYSIRAFAPDGSVARGRILLTYDRFAHGSADPAFDPDLDLIMPGNSLSADAAVPEPGGLALLAAGALAAGCTRRRRTAT